MTTDLSPKQPLVNLRNTTFAYCLLASGLYSQLVDEASKNNLRYVELKGDYYWKKQIDLCRRFNQPVEIVVEPSEVFDEFGRWESHLC